MRRGDALLYISAEAGLRRSKSFSSKDVDERLRRLKLLIYVPPFIAMTSTMLNMTAILWNIVL